jgi:hypothetical protein
MRGVRNHRGEAAITHPSRIDHVGAGIGRRRRHMAHHRHDLQSRRRHAARRRGKPTTTKRHAKRRHHTPFHLLFSMSPHHWARTVDRHRIETGLNLDAAGVARSHASFLPRPAASATPFGASRNFRLTEAADNTPTRRALRQDFVESAVDYSICTTPRLCVATL